MRTERSTVALIRRWNYDWMIQRQPSPGNGPL